MKKLTLLVLFFIGNSLIAQINLGKDIASNAGSKAAIIAYKKNINTEKKLAKSTEAFKKLYSQRNQSELSKIIALRINQKIQRTKNKQERLVTQNQTIITPSCDDIKKKNAIILVHIASEIKMQEDIFRNQSDQMLAGTKTRIFLTGKEALSEINRRLDFVASTIYYYKSTTQPCD